MTCPTLCDPDCDTRCHEAHEVPYKQAHDPKLCEQFQLANPERVDNGCMIYRSSEQR